MPNRPRVILTGFADEAANQKTAVQQFAAFAALGLQYYSIRFIDVGDGVKNVMKLSRSEIQKIRSLEAEYELSVSSIGSPIGKVKLKNVDDGTKNVFVPFKRYLSGDVKKACELAHAFETKLIRGFSFYHPKGEDPRGHLPQAVDQLGQIAEVCHRSDLTFGLEVEANLVGGDGFHLAEIYRQVNHPALVLVFDAANPIVQGFPPPEIPEHFPAMAPGPGALCPQQISEEFQQLPGLRPPFLLVQLRVCDQTAEQDAHARLAFEVPREVRRFDCGHYVVILAVQQVHRGHGGR